MEVVVSKRESLSETVRAAEEIQRLLARISHCDEDDRLLGYARQLRFLLTLSPNGRIGTPQQ